ncbi:ABC transporter ATP-binding protein [Ferrovibrio sp.]|jgi:multiple sugar transport system ATP-binding protein|uniref:ABC transporter ATP-binding protein n=2 Tax=Ferrovibrio sp. TaxID=1917215 RepID=UPI0035B2D0A7
MAGVVIENIRKSFGATQVLKGVSLDIADREFMTLVGPSGCGKSTLLRIIAGLEQQDDGDIRIGGASAGRKRAADRDLAMVFQSYALYPHLTARDNIALPLTMRRLTAWQRLPLIGRLLPGASAARSVIADEVRRVAEILRIGHLLERKPAQLSGGQRQRVALGRAMVRHPAAFLMDEPLSNLDAKLREHMRTEIAQLHQQLSTTFIYVTHDQAEAMTMSDRIAVMMDGEILQVAAPDVIYADPADLRVAEFIGSPKINVVPAEIDGDGILRVGAARFDIAAALPPGSQLKLAFRPEAAELDASSPATLGGVVIIRENLGSDLLVHVQLDAAPDPVIVRLPARQAGVRENDRIGLHVPADQILLFAADGRRLRVVPRQIQARELAYG